MKCSICLEVPVNPTELACGHSFCYKCIYRWVIEKTDSTPHVQPVCPVCRSYIKGLNTGNQRKTRTMTHLERQRRFAAAVIARISEWRELRYTKNPPPRIQSCEFFTFLDEVLRLMYRNIWFFYRRTPAEAAPRRAWRQLLRMKLDRFEQDGYQEAPIWRYKFRHILNG